MKDYKLTIKGPGMDFPRLIDLKKVGEIMILLGEQSSQQAESNLTKRTEIDGSSSSTSKLRSKSSKSLRSRSLNYKNINEKVQQMEISPIHNGTNYHDLKIKGDKILWLLNYAFDKGIEALSSSEIQFFSNGLRGIIHTRDFRALNGRNLKKGFVIKDPNTGKFKIQQSGLEYLKGFNQQQDQ